jgi:hypothetical protein
VAKTRATNLPNSEVLDQLCDLILAKLEERQQRTILLSSGSSVRSITTIRRSFLRCHGWPELAPLLIGPFERSQRLGLGLRS